MGLFKWLTGGVVLFLVLFSLSISTPKISYHLYVGLQDVCLYLVLFLASYVFYGRLLCCNRETYQWCLYILLIEILCVLSVTQGLINYPKLSKVTCNKRGIVLKHHSCKTSDRKLEHDTRKHRRIPWLTQDISIPICLPFVFLNRLICMFDAHFFSVVPGME